MKNALLFQINSLFAYLTISAPVSIDFACRVLSFQTKFNDFFEYDWSNAVAQYNSNRK